MRYIVYAVILDIMLLRRSTQCRYNIIILSMEQFYNNYDFILIDSKFRIVKR